MALQNRAVENANKPTIIKLQLRKPVFVGCFKLCFVNGVQE